jgi:hypothetical protein
MPASRLFLLDVFRPRVNRRVFHFPVHRGHRSHVKLGAQINSSD